MIGSRGIPAHSGGIERVVDELTRQLSARGHEVLVYCRRHYVRPGIQASNGTMIFTPGLSGKHLDAITHTTTAALDVLRRKVDVVHFHAAGPALVSWIPAMAHHPVALTVHAADWHRDKWSGPAKWMLRAGLNIGMRTAGTVTAVAEPLAEELSTRYNRSVDYIPNAPSSRPSGQAKLQDGLQPEHFMLFVGRIVPEKRLDLLLKAWQQAAVNSTLVVAGEYADSPYGRQCKRDAPDNVRFLGPQYGQALEALYANASLVVQPSVLEGMSLVLLEAAEHGRCIVAADIPENHRALGDAAAYFPPDNIAGLASQIGRCLNDTPFRENLGREAQHIVRKNFSWSRVAEQYEQVYLRLAATSQRE